MGVSRSHIQGQGIRTLDHLRPCVHALLLHLHKFAIFILVFGLPVLLDVVNPQRSFEDLCAVEIVNSQDGRTLIFIHEKCEASWFTSLFVARHVDIHYLSIPVDGQTDNVRKADHSLGENGDHVAFCELLVQTTNEDPGRILVVVMPRRLETESEFALIYSIDFFDYAVDSQ